MTTQSNVTQIRAWKVFLFTVITAGIYALVWMVRRYRELDEETREPVPHWVWLISMVTSAFLAAIFLSISTISVENTRHAAEISVYGSMIISLLLTLGVVWWSVRYLRALHRALNTPTSTLSLAVMALFCVPLAVTIMQYAINRPAVTRSQLGPIFKRVMYVSLFIGIVGLLFSFSFNAIEADIRETEKSIINIQDDLKKLNQE